MVRTKNSFYSTTIDELHRDKDSIIEMVKVISYDSERLVAKIFGLSSKKYYDDVPVFFSAMFLNTGIISPPVPNSTSLLFWGPDRQPFLLPIQFIIPSVKVTNGVNKLNASPSARDRLKSLENIQPGEHLLRSLGGAYVFLKNMGDIEMGTSRLHRVSLTEKDGALDMILERLRGSIGNSNLYFGPASMDSNDDPRTHLYFALDEFSDISEQIEDMEEENLIDSVLQGDTDNIPLVETPKLAEYQIGHVLDEEGSAVLDAKDESELYSSSTINKGEYNRTETLSKKGRKSVTASGPEGKTTVTQSSTEVLVEHEHMVDGESHTTTIGISEDGNIVCGKDGESYDLMPMLKWFYEERTQPAPSSSE